ncbi:hypothetical protein MMYC01_200948 [Madurella mycetomatis]|uniref:Uncharacterized protein n=1 Tax=Madurella mycetomatis TaxID=100816 RepID=A0A175WE33_9PEZI|nr:hypothetical protein MMYC01_200948 [Madurella mycetomatis]
MGSDPEAQPPQLGGPSSSENDDILSQPAYVIEWEISESEEPPAGRVRQWRTPLATVLALSAALEATNDNDRHTLIVLHGHRPEFAGAIRAFDADMDPRFIDCVATRKTYRTVLGLRNQMPGAHHGRRWHVLEYPELTEGLGPSTSRDNRAGGGPPVRRLLGRGGKVSVVFRRASLWTHKAGKGVLFLDAPTRRDAAAGGVNSRQRTDDEKGVQTPHQSDISSLEDVLWDALGVDRKATDPFDRLLSETVYDRWLELFELLDPEPHAMSQETVSGYWQILRSLELNEDDEADPRWTSLLSRIQRRIALLPAPSDKLPYPPPETSRSTTANTTSDVPRNKTITRTSTVNRSLSSPPKQGHDSKPLIDENQRALDRISYLGGILIPIPIVAGVLSMGETFGPSGPMFYVFWAASIPLSIVTVLIIYADTIRKAEVWVEIAADHVEPTPDSAIDSDKEDVGPVDVEVKHRRTVTWRKRTSDEHQRQQPPSPEAVVFSIDHDVEERMIGTPVTAAAATARLADEDAAGAMLDLLPASDRWRTGLVAPPDVILEEPVDGSKPRAWKRKELGWYGAAKAIVYKKPRAGRDVPAGVAACTKPKKQKTSTW